MERGPEGSGRQAAADLSIVFEIGLKYRRRLDIIGILATILLKSTERIRTPAICGLHILSYCST